MSSEVPIILSISGGKDSAALALHLRELGVEPAARIWMDTGWEHADTYRYIDEVLEPALGPIARLRVDVPVLAGFEAEVDELETMLGGRPSPMVRLCVWKGYFPGQGTRWCTQALKTVPAARFLAGCEEDVKNAVGVRAQESASRAKMPEREPMSRVEVPPAVRLAGEDRWIDLDHVEQWRPLLRWSEQDVVDIHRRHGLPLNPLYRAGASRVGCWPCIFARKDELRLLAKDDTRVEVLRRLEAIVGQRTATRKTERQAVGKEQRKEMPPPAWFQIRDPLSRTGTLHACQPIDHVLKWAATARGGRQIEAFAPPASDWACSRWGYCETSPQKTRGQDE